MYKITTFIENNRIMTEEVNSLNEAKKIANETLSYLPDDVAVCNVTEEGKLLYVVANNGYENSFEDFFEGCCKDLSFDENSLSKELNKASFKEGVAFLKENNLLPMHVEENNIIYVAYSGDLSCVCGYDKEHNKWIVENGYKDACYANKAYYFIGDELISADDEFCPKYNTFTWEDLNKEI